MSRDARNEAVLCEQHLKIVRALRSRCGRKQTSSVITIEPGDAFSRECRASLRARAGKFDRFGRGNEFQRSKYGCVLKC